MTRLVTRRSLAALGFILLLAASMRFLMIAHAPAFVTDGDSFAASYQLAKEGSFAVPLKRAPLYPLFLSGIIAVVGPSLEAATIAQHLLGVVTVALVYLTGAVLFGRTTGLVAALLTAINGPVILTEHTIGSEALVAPVLASSLFLLVLSLRRRLAPLMTLAGVTLGLAALAQPMLAASLPIFLGALALQRRAWRPRLLGVGLLWAGFLLVVGPWALRNQVVHGVSTISTGVGEALFERTRLYDTGFDFRDHTRSPFEPSLEAAIPRALELTGTGMQETRVQRILQNERSLTQAEVDAVLVEAAKRRLVALAQLNTSGSRPRSTLQAEFRLSEAELDLMLRQASTRLVFDLAQTRADAGEIRKVLSDDFRLSPAQTDAAMRDAALQVIKQQPGHYLLGTLSISVKQRLQGDGGNLTRAWETRTKGEVESAWPEPLRVALESPPNHSAEDRAAADALVSFYQDRRLGVLFAIFFVVGVIRCCFTDRRRGAVLLPVVVLTQLVLYVALWGSAARFRQPLQPLITLVVAGGLTMLLSQARAWTLPRLAASTAAGSRVTRRAWFALATVLMVNFAFLLNNLAPYYGLNYAGAMLMYSELGTRATNHLFIPKSPLSEDFSYATIHEINPRGADPTHAGRFMQFIRWTEDNTARVNLNFIRYHVNRLCRSSPDTSVRVSLQTETGKLLDFGNACAEPSMLWYAVPSSYRPCTPGCGDYLHEWAASLRGRG